MAPLFLSQSAAAKYLGIAPRTLREWTKKDPTLPRYVDPDTGRIRYPRLALREWSADRRHGSEAA